MFLNSSSDEERFENILQPSTSLETERLQKVGGELDQIRDSSFYLPAWLPAWWSDGEETKLEGPERDRAGSVWRKAAERSASA